MLTINNVSLRFPTRKLFDNINLNFTAGNCYGIIGANGAGKSTLLNIISGEIESTTGNITVEPGRRMSVLKQNHFAFEDYKIMDVVIMGHTELYKIMKEKDAIYMKEDFTDADGIRAGELESEFADLNGWEAESDAAKLLTSLGIELELHELKMSDISVKQKIKVLIAQCLFGNPDILIMDEPTNGLDFKSKKWLEDFLIDYDNTIIVVSHDRHFLNKVCTHMVDIDYGTAKLYPGNYDFWYESSQLMLQLTKDANKKKEQKIKELESFIARFSANASKSKQATSRKKSLEKIELDDIKPSSRKYPFINFTVGRELGKEVLTLNEVSKKIDGKEVLKNVTFSLNKGEKIYIEGDDLSKRTLFELINGDILPDSGEIRLGQTVDKEYLPLDMKKYFEGSELSLIDWLRQYSKDQTESFIRGFLGRMLFSGDETLKKVSVLSGGEKMRLMFSKMMVKEANFLMMDQPTNHLDLESIQGLNDGLKKYQGCLMFTSHDFDFANTIANKIVTLTKQGAYYSECTFDEYMNDEKIQKKIEKMNE